MENKIFLVKMGNRIYDARKSLKLTQEQLAEKIDVSTQMISNLELGKKAIRPENLAKISHALNVSADYLLTGHNCPDSCSYISAKLSKLNPNELSIIKDIIDYMCENRPE